MTDTTNTPLTPRKKRRGRWWKILLSLVVLLLMLVLFLPAIVSTSPVRNIILGQINSRVPGKLQVSNWSLGWFSNTQLQDVQWTDEQGKITVGDIKTNVTLSQLARGNMHFGDVFIRNVQIDRNVQLTNPHPQSQQPATKAPPQPSSPSSSSSQPISIPDITATIHVENVAGQILLKNDAGQSFPIAINSATTALIDLPAGGGPAKCDAKLQLAQPAGVISITTAINGIKPGPLNLQTLSGNASLKMDSFALATLTDIAKLYNLDLKVNGTLDAAFDVKAGSASDISVTGALNGTEISIAGAALKGDKLVTHKLQIPLDLALAGKGDAARLTINKLAVLLDQAQLNATGSVPLVSLTQLQNGQPITQDGSINITGSVPGVAQLLNSLRHSLPLREGVNVTAGAIDMQANATFARDGLRIHVPLSVHELAATENKNPIGPLAPITLLVDARLQSLSAAGVHDLNTNIASSFFTLAAKGSSLATLTANGDADLAKLKQEFGQIFDLSMIGGGHLSLNIVNRSGSSDTLEPDARILLENLTLDFPDAAKAPARRLDGGTVLITARAKVQGNQAQLITPARVEISGRLLDVSGNKKPVTLLLQSASMVIDGSADLTPNARTLHLTQLTASLGKEEPLAVLKLRDPSADLALSGKRGISGNIPLTLQSNITGILATLKPLGIEPLKTLSNAVLNGPITLAITPDGDMQLALMDVGVDYSVLGKKPFKDHLAINAAALVAGNSQIRGNAKIQSSMLELNAPAFLYTPAMSADEPMKVTADVAIKADIQKLMQLAQGDKANQYVITGALSGNSKLNMTDGELLASIQWTLDNLQVFSRENPVVTESQCSINGEVRVLSQSKQFFIDSFNIGSRDGLLNAKVTGKITELGTTNRLEGVRLEFTPDYARVWPIGYAILTPAQQKSIGELALQGKQTSSLVFDGSYPTNLPHNQAIRQLAATGHLVIDKVDYKKYGIVAESVDVPVLLDQGHIRFVTKSETGYTQARPINVNQGKFTLAGLDIDLTGDAPRLIAPANTPLARQIQLNPVLTASLGTYLSPLLAGATESSGSVDLVIIRAEGLPLGAAMMVPGDKGYGEFSVSANNLSVTGKGLSQFQEILNVGAITGGINDGRITISNGQCLQKVTLNLGKYAIGFDGKLRLSDNYFESLKALVPAQTIERMVKSKALIQYMPDTVGLHFTGPAAALKLDQSTITDLTNAAIQKQLQSGLLGGLSGNKTTPANQTGTTTQPAKPTPEDAAGAIIDLFNRKKK